MRTLSFPLRLDSAGQLATIDDASSRAAAELAGQVLSTSRGERPLAPSYGMTDPLTVGVDAGGAEAAIALSEPELAVRRVDVQQSGASSVTVTVDVEWSAQ